MNSNLRTVIAIGVAGLAAVLLLPACSKQEEKAASAPQQAAPAAGQQPVAGALQPGAQAPADAVHAPAIQSEQPQQAAAPEPQRQGKVKADPTAKFTHFRVGNRNVKDVFIDGKVVWVGTSGGVIRYDTASDEYRMWDAKTGLLSNGIFHVSKIDDRVIVGTYGGGMSMLTDAAAGQWKNYNIPEGLGDPFVYDVIKTANGDVWIATWSGANRVRGGALDDRSKWDLFTVENTKGGLPNDWVYGLSEGKNGEVWFATEGGLARYKDGKWQNWNHDKGLGAPYEKVKSAIQFGTDPASFSEHHAKQKKELGTEAGSGAYNPNYIVSMAVDKDGSVWVGTWGGGLSHFDGKKWKTYTTVEGLPGNHVFMLHMDSKWNLWIGTNKGLARFENGGFSVMTTADGLFSDAVFSMTMGNENDIWVGSFGGLTHMRLDR